MRLARRPSASRACRIDLLARDRFRCRMGLGRAFREGTVDDWPELVQFVLGGVSPGAAPEQLRGHAVLNEAADENERHLRTHFTGHFQRKGAAAERKLVIGKYDARRKIPQGGQIFPLCGYTADLKPRIVPPKRASNQFGIRGVVVENEDANLFVHARNLNPGRANCPSAIFGKKFTSRRAMAYGNRGVNGNRPGNGQFP